MSDSDANRRQQIMDAALRVFSRQGFHKATIKQIAAEAKVKSPALIYWYFPSKEELLKAVLGRLMPILPQVDAPEVLMELPPEQVFTMIGRMLFDAADNPSMSHLLRVFFSEALRTPATIDQIAEIGPLRVLGFMTTYLQRQVDNGQMRPHDPQASARAFMGMLMVYLVGHDILPSFGKNAPEGAAYLDEIVKIFLNGLKPE